MILLIQTNSELLLREKYKQYDFDPKQKLSQYPNYVCLNCNIEEALENAKFIIET